MLLTLITSLLVEVLKSEKISVPLHAV